MRYLIDGYNLMFAGGLLGKRLGPDGFRRVRTRFLNDLAHALGPLDSSQTTVVFDASTAHGSLDRSTIHLGISVIYAVDNENADERIEELIAADSAPKSLSVVSTDRRIRQAAGRRKALAVTADDFWVELDARKRRRTREVPPVHTESPTERTISAEESAYWLREFRDLDASPETRKALNAEPSYLSDEEIAALEREIEREQE